MVSKPSEIKRPVFTSEDDLSFNPWEVDFANKKIVIKPSVLNQRLDLNMNDPTGAGGSITLRHIDFTSTDATPSVINANICETAGTTAITDFDDGVIGQVIFIKATDSITITDGIPIILYNNVDYLMTAGDTLVLAMFDDQIWHEISRSENGVAGAFGSCWGNHISWAANGGGAAVQNVWYNIFDTDMTDGQLNNVTHDGSGELTVLKAGKYIIGYSACYFDNVANDHVEIGIEISDSGAAENDGRSHSENKFSNEEEHLSSSAILDLAAGATIELAVRTIDSTNPIIYVDGMNITAVKIG